MRRAGAGLWLLDKPQARAQAEALARAQFARYRDPYECMLVYLALGKKAVLQTLFRQARNAPALPLAFNLHPSIHPEGPTTDRRSEYRRIGP